MTGRIRRFFPEEASDIGQSKREGRLRDVQEQLGRDRNRLIRGQISEAEFQKRVGAHRRGMREAAEPLTLAAAEAFLRGDAKATRDAIEKLVESGPYRDREAALAAVEQVSALLEKLDEREALPLGTARSLAEELLAETRERGGFAKSNPLVARFQKELDALPESEQDALLDWFEEQQAIARRVHAQKRKSTTPRPTSSLPWLPESRR